MDCKNYVLKHDFGYGREPELNQMIKLKLRNEKDLKVYILDVLENSFVNFEKIKISIKKM